MLSNLFILVIYQFIFLLLKWIYKAHIEKKYDYKIPTKGFPGLVDRNITYYDEEVINNKNLSKQINYLFASELIGIFIMIIGAIYFLLV